MAAPNTQHCKQTSGTTHFSNYKVGDLIRIRGSNNNGIYTITEITDDGSSSFLGLSGKQLADASSDSGVYIDKLETVGDKIIIVGSEDGGNCHLWSYNQRLLDKNISEDEGINQSTHGKSPFIGAMGWSKNAITTRMTWAEADSNKDSKYDFLLADGSLRACDTEVESISVIKRFGPVNHIQFNNNVKGGHHLGFEEHINTLAKPIKGGYINAAATDSAAFYTSTSLSNELQLRKYIVAIDGTADHFYDLAVDGIQFDDTLKAGSTSDAALIPLGMVFGLGNDTDNDNGTSIGDERFMIRKVDISSLYFHVYRAYAGSTSVDVASNTFKYIYRYGCGWNFKVAENSVVDSGTYMSGAWEFAQSFIYDGNQESLLRTDLDVGAANQLTQSNDFRALDIDIYGFGPYNGRITGGRIYIREASTDDEWSLLADIDIVKGCRTSMEAEYTAWTSRDGITNGKNGMFSCGTLTSKGMQIDSFATINGYSHRADRNSIGYMNENYQTSIVANRRAFVANLRLTNSSGVVEKFGDRIMFSEPNKFDVFPDTNTIDVSKGDAEEYTALEFYADRLLAFKHRTLQIINIASPSPSGWFLEETVKHSGVSFKHSVIKTEYGICWANTTGCYLFDGTRIRNLIDNKIKASGTTQYSLAPSWDNFIRSSDYVIRPVLIYVPKHKKLIVQRCANDASSSSNQTYIYDFSVNGWHYNSTLFTDSVEYTNPILDWNNNAVFAVDEGFLGPGDLNYGAIPTIDDSGGISSSDTEWGHSDLNLLHQGDVIKYGSEQILVRDIDLTSATAGNVFGVRGWNGSNKASHADDAGCDWSAIAFKQIAESINTSGAGSLVQSFVTKDIDFGDPTTVKKVYKIYFTYKNTAACGSASSNIVQFALDGNTTFAQSSVSSSHGSGSFELTGSFNCGITNWDVAVFTFSSPVPCQSIALKLLTSAGAAALWFNDISFEYRTLPAKRVV
jgi:hypothetical protein